MRRQSGFIQPLPIFNEFLCNFDCFPFNYNLSYFKRVITVERHILKNNFLWLLEKSQNVGFRQHLVALNIVSTVLSREVLIIP